MSTIYNKYKALREYLSKGKRTVQECALFLEKDQRTAYRALAELKKDPCFRHEKQGKSSLFFIEDRTQYENDNLIRNLEKIVKKSSGSASEARMVLLLQKLIDNLKKQDNEALPDSIFINEDFIIDLGPFAVCDFNKEKTKYDRYLQAIKQHLKLRIEYLPSNTGKSLRYTICPLKLIMRIDTVYLYACIDGEESVPRVFVLEQILKMTITKDSFAPISLKLTELYRYSFAKWIPNLQEYPPERILLEAKSSWAAALFSRVNFSSVEQGECLKKGNKTFLRLNLSVTPDFKSWLFGLLDVVRICEPESLRIGAEEYLKLALKALKE